MAQLPTPTTDADSVALMTLQRMERQQRQVAQAITNLALGLGASARLEADRHDTLYGILLALVSATPRPKGKSKSSSHEKGESEPSARFPLPWGGAFEIDAARARAISLDVLKWVGITALAAVGWLWHFLHIHIP